MSGVLREAVFLLRDRAAVLWIVLALLASALAVWLGLGEVASQRAEIDRLRIADRVEREIAAEGQPDWGSAAYYTFHLTWNAPSNSAFAALGTRDGIPWKHNIRMLALEGQIHESDAGNPVFSLTRRFDFAFVVSLLAPLFAILLLHDLRGREHAAGRLSLLEATARSSSVLWLLRGGLRMAGLGLALLLPLWFGGLTGGAAMVDMGLMSLLTLLHLGFWWGLCVLVNRLSLNASVNLIALSALWAILGLILPAAMRAGVDAAVPVPDGGDIILTQREAVNDAWDLPKEATMEPFLTRHPEWTEYANVQRPFEWKWYYAFQQVGDQTAETLSQAYREGRERRDAIAGWLALLSPPALVERRLQAIAGTDMSAALAYEQSVRDFHAALRAWHYPRLFRDEPYDVAALDSRPEFAGVDDQIADGD